MNEIIAAETEYKKNKFRIYFPQLVLQEHEPQPGRKAIKDRGKVNDW